MISNTVYTKGVVSVQASVLYEGKPHHVLIRDPERPHGLSWPGGYFFPTGDLRTSAADIVQRETGIPVDAAQLRMNGIIYSLTKVHKHWIGNCFFSVRAPPVETWRRPEEGYETFLVPTDSLQDPQHVIAIHGQRPTKFEWSITDGPVIARLMHTISRNYTGGAERRYFKEIPVIPIPVPATRMPFGYGMGVASFQLAHTYKGKEGFVYIKNEDDPTKNAVIGGKIESLGGVDSRNLDAISCMLEEGQQEIGVETIARSIIGCALTPLDAFHPNPKREENGRNSILNTCFLAAPRNPRQLDDALENPDQYKERGKVEGIYFLPTDEYRAMLEEGNMRTPDMAPLGLAYLNGCPSRRPNLEQIMVVPSQDVPDPHARPETRPCKASE